MSGPAFTSCFAVAIADFAFILVMFIPLKCGHRWPVEHPMCPVGSDIIQCAAPQYILYRGRKTFRFDCQRTQANAVWTGNRLSVGQFDLDQTMRQSVAIVNPFR